MLRKLLAVAALCFASTVANAAPFPSLSMDVGVCDPNAPTNCIKPDASGNVPVTGTISASLGGFTPSASGARGTPLTVTTSDSSGNLPTGAVVIVSNVGTTNPMYCNVNAVAATTSDQLIAANSWFAFTIPGAVTTLRCIATGGSTTANMLGGAGLATGAGGGSAGGGSGGSVTQGTDPWLVAGKGTAGTPSGGVVSVQGVAGGTAQPISQASGSVASGSYSSGAFSSGSYASGSLAAGAMVDLLTVIGSKNAGTASASSLTAGGVYNSTPLTLTNTQQASHQLDANGYLKVNVVAGGAGGGAVTMASGAVASGAYASGAFASGSGADGWDVSTGATTATAATAGSTGSVNAKLRLMTTQLDTLNTNVTSPPPLNVNAVNTAWTGLTPGVAQTGTIIAANMDLSSVAGIALGAMANYGTSPGTVKVQGVNAFVTNTVPVTLTSTTITGTVAATQSGTWTMQPGNTANTTAWLMGLNTTPTIANGNGTVPTQAGAVLSITNPSFTRLTDGTTAQVTDPCQGNAKTILPITLATAAVKVIATGVSAKKIYVCAIDLTNNAADSVAVFEATTATTCATAAVAVVGAGTSVATAATGYNFAANGGISKGQGGFSVWQTTVNNNDLCIAQSAATQLTGTIAYVTQ